MASSQAVDSLVQSEYFRFDVAPAAVVVAEGVSALEIGFGFFLLALEACESLSVLANRALRNFHRASAVPLCTERNRRVLLACGARIFPIKLFTCVCLAGYDWPPTQDGVLPPEFFQMGLGMVALHCGLGSEVGGGASSALWGAHRFLGVHQGARGFMGEAIFSIPKQGKDAAEKVTISGECEPLAPLVESILLWRVDLRGLESIDLVLLT